MADMSNLCTNSGHIISEPAALRNRFLLDRGQNKAMVSLRKFGRASMQQVGILTTGAVFLFLGAILIGFV